MVRHTCPCVGAQKLERALVEAAPRDQIWGVGFGQHNARALEPSQWRGQNLLGFALVDVREKLRESV